jgi:hypothetical protein
MSNEILCGGCGKVYPLWIAANAKPANCSDCGTQVEQRHVEQHEVPPQFSGGGSKGKAMWIVGGLASIALLMLVICGGGVGAYYYVTEQGASEKSQKEAEYRRAQEEMADAMERFSKGEVTASYAMDKISQAKDAEENLYKDD